MNNGDLLEKIDIDTGRNNNLCEKEVEVQFDFPLHGAANQYKIVSYKDGVITLYNPDCARPLGHE